MVVEEVISEEGRGLRQSIIKMKKVFQKEGNCKMYLMLLEECVMRIEN